jgi:hypothetical protein
MMIRRAKGRIDSYTKETEDGAITCGACSRIVVSKENLTDGKFCPYCHQDVNIVLADEELVEDTSDDIAVEC